jgi:hypothetical protein
VHRLVHAGLGHKDEAFGWLDRTFEERSHWLVWLRLDPRWKTLRDDPRFAKLIERINTRSSSVSSSCNARIACFFGESLSLCSRSSSKSRNPAM